MALVVYAHTLRVLLGSVVYMLPCITYRHAILQHTPPVCTSADGAQLLRRSVGDAVQECGSTVVSYYLMCYAHIALVRILYLVVVRR